MPEIFNNLLSGSDIVVQHMALEAFTKFAEVTIHESVVPQCIQDNQHLQNSVMAFLNKVIRQLASNQCLWLLNHFQMEI